MKTIKVATDFAKSPMGASRTEGPYSGQVFREDILLPALIRAIATGDTVLVDMFHTNQAIDDRWLRGAFFGLEAMFGKSIYSMMTIKAPPDEDGPREYFIIGYMRSPTLWGQARFPQYDH